MTSPVQKWRNKSKPFEKESKKVEKFSKICENVEFRPQTLQFFRQMYVVPDFREIRIKN